MFTRQCSFAGTGSEFVHNAKTNIIFFLGILARNTLNDVWVVCCRINSYNAENCCIIFVYDNLYFDPHECSLCFRC